MFYPTNACKFIAAEQEADLAMAETQTEPPSPPPVDDEGMTEAPQPLYITFLLLCLGCRSPLPSPSILTVLDAPRHMRVSLFFKLMQQPSVAYLIYVCSQAIGVGPRQPKPDKDF